jgi:hypothetical protein
MSAWKNLDVAKILTAEIYHVLQIISFCSIFLGDQLVNVWLKNQCFGD